MSRVFEFTDIEELKNTGKVLVGQPKYDGFYLELRVKNKKGKVITREGADRGTRPVDLPDGVYYGEWLYGTTWAKEQFLKGKFYDHMMLFDMKGGEIYGKRFQELSKRVKACDQENVHVSEFEILKDATDAGIRAFRDRCIKNGFEGCVFRMGDTPTYAGTRMKATTTLDYVIVDFEYSDADWGVPDWGPGGKPKKIVKAIVGGLYFDGKLEEVCKVGSFDLDNRKNMSLNPKKYLGKVFEAEGNKLFKSGCLRHPRFLRWRPDKPAKDCVLDMKKVK